MVIIQLWMISKPVMMVAFAQPQYVTHRYEHHHGERRLCRSSEWRDLYNGCVWFCRLRNNLQTWKLKNTNTRFNVHIRTSINNSELRNWWGCQPLEQFFYLVQVLCASSMGTPCFGLLRWWGCIDWLGVVDHNYQTPMIPILKHWH